MPEVAVVKSLAAWMLAEAFAGGTPIAISAEEETMPYPMPSAPSIICARNPTNAKMANSAPMPHPPAAVASQT